MSKSEKINKILTEVEEAERNYKRKKKELAASCDHKKKSGKLSLDQVDGDIYRCKKCKQEFSLRKIQRKEATKAAEVINDMIQQIKCFSNDETDEKLLKELGSMSCSLETILDLYNKCLKSIAKKDKKKNKDSFGNYGFQGMSFINNKK